MRNLTFFNAGTALNQLWDWSWNYMGISINNCSVGLNMSATVAGAQSVGSITFVDSNISNTAVGILMARSSTNSTPPSGGSLILENVHLNNVPVAVQGPGNTTVLAGSSGPSTVAAWGQGHSYTPKGPKTFQGHIDPNIRPPTLVSGTDYYHRSKPQYEDLPASAFSSVRDGGAKGNGVADDTAALQAVIKSAAAAGQVVFFDAGTYKVTKALHIPPGSKIVGEAYSVIMSSGKHFADINNPKAVVRVGREGDFGTVEWSDMIVSTQGAQPGAILIKWNLAALPECPSGMWDVHTRIGGFAGSQLQLADCPTANTTVYNANNIRQNCLAAFMSMHVTPTAMGLYLENNWFWVADVSFAVPGQTCRRLTMFYSTTSRIRN